MNLRYQSLPLFLPYPVVSLSPLFYLTPIDCLSIYVLRLYVFLRLVFALCMLIAYAEGSSLELCVIFVYSPSTSV